jgi:hypothetical protein
MRCRVALLALALTAGPAAAAEPVAFPFRDGDRVAFVGSSSTHIGVWPRTVEFLVRTRHPELRVEFRRFSTGGGTFATGREKLDGWLDEFRPTVVLFNYGGNDANAGEKGLPTFRENMAACFEKARGRGAHVVFSTPQAADDRKAGKEAADRRRLYATDLLAFAGEKGWPAVDVFAPLEALQAAGQRDDEAYTILKDKIHLTDPAYIAWGHFFYAGLNPPPATSLAGLTADGTVTAENRCRVTDVKHGPDGLSFTRHDAVLPILPPIALPPRKYVPLERIADYRLRVTGLPAVRYAVACEGKPVGTASAAELAAGVNLNTLLLDAGLPAPWQEQAARWWDGKGVDEVGRTAWRFAVRPKTP